MPGGEEKRGAPRVRCEVRVRVLSPKAASGMARDISQTGMLLELARPPLIPVGKELQVQFQLDKKHKPITARAQVRRHAEKNAMGIKFLMLPMESVQEIGTYVENGEPV